MGPISNVVNRYNSEHECGRSSGSHTTPTANKDRDMIIHELKKYSGLIIVPSPTSYATPSRHSIMKTFINGLSSIQKSKVLT